jgi:putative pyruvate formate lyase activating enzyme
VFCQNWDISQFPSGAPVESRQLAASIEHRKKQGARNVNWVGGDPTSNLLFILKVLRHLECNIAQVWNSNMYCSEETMTLLHGVIDVYLTDFKYGNDSCAKRLSTVDGYMTIVKRNHLLAYHQAEMIIRHLVLPNHATCCSQRIFDWIKRNTPEAVVNIMAQYKPEYHADQYEEIARPLSQEEYVRVRQYAETLDLHLI